MMLIITPKGGWRRRIVAFKFRNQVGDGDKFTVYQLVHSYYVAQGKRDKYNITLAPISAEQLEQWIYENVEPTWWEILTRRTRYSVSTLIPIEN